MSGTPSAGLGNPGLHPLAQQVDMPKMACGLLDQMQQDPAQRHVPLGRHGVKGGGAQGAALKEFLHYPGINERTYPYHDKPGFWYLYEIAFGTHPKGFRSPQELLETGSTTP